MQRQSDLKTLFFSNRIINALHHIFDYPITVVEAPMGYGKTTAVKSYLTNVDANILWLKISLKSRVHFWESLCKLLSEVNEEISEIFLELGFPSDHVAVYETVSQILKINFPQKTVLVIDDYHIMNSPEIGNLIEMLAMCEIENFHLVINTRYIELNAMEELQLKGYLYHIKKDVFELMPDDIIRYYKQCGLGIKRDEAEALYNHTEGWISALYLSMLNFKETGNLITYQNIYKLIENAIYMHFPEDIKALLVTLSIFDSFTEDQAIYMWGDVSAKAYLYEIITKNAFVNFDSKSETYYIHSIFINFLRRVMNTQGADFIEDLYIRAGSWYMGKEDYLPAMAYYYEGKDFDQLLAVVELDKANSITYDQREVYIKYFDECPEIMMQNHLLSILIFAMCMMTYNEMAQFEKSVSQFQRLIEKVDLEDDQIEHLMGEFELLMSFTKYNDMLAMSQHHKKALGLLKKPSVFMDTKGSWTFGAPSVLYIFHRKSGSLNAIVEGIEEANHYYNQLTNGHGAGGECIIAAEQAYFMGNFEDAEIGSHKAIFAAKRGTEPSISICALFIQMRLNLHRGNYKGVLEGIDSMRECIERQRNYTMLHMIDLCQGYVYAFLGQRDKIPEWLVSGNFDSSGIYFQARGFANIIYGKTLLLEGKHLKLLGISEQLREIANMFPNVLAGIYTEIFIATAKNRIQRLKEASQSLECAIELAIKDHLIMPFVENYDDIQNLLDGFYNHSEYRDFVSRIRSLASDFSVAKERIRLEHFTEVRPKLTVREDEIARLAAEGFSNKGIADHLFISQNTVKTQLKSVFEKLGVNSRALLNQYFEMEE